MAMRQTGAVKVWKALWWGDGAKPHILEMLRLLYLEMFGFSLTAPFGTIKAQTLSNQVELVLVFIIMRWSRSDGAPFGILHPNRKVSAVHLVIMIRLSRLEMQRIFRVTNQNES